MAILFLVVLCVPILIWSLKLFHTIWWTPKMLEKKLREQGIYCPPYKLIHGNTKERRKLMREASSKPMKLSHDIMPRIDPVLHTIAGEHKKEFVIWEGTTPGVNITDPKLIREVLGKVHEFPKQKPSPYMHLFLQGLANVDGDKWATHRKIISPAFKLEKLKRLFHTSFMTCCEEMIEKWDNKSLGSAGSSFELDVLSEFQDLTRDVISRAAFGINLEEGRPIFSLLKKQEGLFLQSHSASINFPFSFPWSRFFPSKIVREMMQVHAEIGALTAGIIRKRVKALESSNKESSDDDLLNLLLKSNLKEFEENRKPNVGMTREDVIEECKLFYFAGHETTANLLTWTMITLSMHPSWQEKAREEVLRVIGKNKPSFDDLSNLKIVNMILLEVLRLYPPTSLVRCTYKETKVGDFTLPAGVGLRIPVYLTQRDPEIWGEDALEFNPDRFSDGVSKASKDPASFFAFGWGPRVCIGQNFAVTEAKLALSLILQHFSFELSPTYAHAPVIILTLKPQFGAQIILRKL